MSPSRDSIAQIQLQSANKFAMNVVKRIEKFGPQIVLRPSNSFSVSLIHTIGCITHRDLIHRDLELFDLGICDLGI